MLNGKVKNVIEVDVYDVDNEITAFLKEKGVHNKNFDKYGYECIPENEWSNYQKHSFDVEPEALDPDDLADVQVRLPSTGEILNWMCLEGKITPGEYLINVFW